MTELQRPAVTDELILAELAKGEASAAAVAESLGRFIWEVTDQLKRMARRGLVERTGWAKGKTRPSRVWALKQNGDA